MGTIEENDLYQKIIRKKEITSKKINRIELGLIVINSIVSVILFTKIFRNNESFGNYASALLLSFTVLILIYFRQKRQKKITIFDQSVLGELDYTIANSKSIIKISSFMIYYYLIPIGVFSISKMIYLGASIEKWLLIIGMYILALFLIWWERKACHIPNQQSLEIMRKKLTE